MTNEANERGCLEKFAAFPIKLILAAFNAIDFSCCCMQAFKRKTGLNITTELLSDSNLLLQVVFAFFEHCVSVAPSKNHKAFPIRFYLSAGLAAVLALISWGTEEQFMPATTLMSKQRSKESYVHSQKSSKTAVAACEGLASPWTERMGPAFCHFKGTCGDIQMQRMVGGCAEHVARTAEPLSTGE